MNMHKYINKYRLGIEHVFDFKLLGQASLRAGVKNALCSYSSIALFFVLTYTQLYRCGYCCMNFTSYTSYTFITVYYYMCVYNPAELVIRLDYTESAQFNTTWLIIFTTTLIYFYTKISYFV